MRLLNDLFRLEVHWSKVLYKEGVCFFEDAYFCGPVLTIAEKIQDNDSIHLDFFEQYYIVVENVYIGKLSWEKILYKNDKVYLNNCKLEHKTELNKAPKLSDTDYMVIDCSDHDRSVHDWHPNYKTYIVNLDTQVYNYEK